EAREAEQFTEAGEAVRDGHGPRAAVLVASAVGDHARAGEDEVADAKRVRPRLASGGVEERRLPGAESTGDEYDLRVPRLRLAEPGGKATRLRGRDPRRLGERAVRIFICYHETYVRYVCLGSCPAL